MLPTDAIKEKAKADSKVGAPKNFLFLLPVSNLIKKSEIANAFPKSTVVSSSDEKHSYTVYSGLLYNYVNYAHVYQK